MAMSTRIPSRLAAFHPRPQWTPSTSLPVTSRRHFLFEKKGNKKDDDELANPILDDYLKKNKVAQPDQNQGPPQRMQLRQGTLSTTPSSLFKPEVEIPGWYEDASPTQVQELRAAAKQRESEAQKEKDKKLTDMTLDPNPQARRNLERKLIIAGVKRHGRMTKAQKLARTERESVYKSHFLPTSTKKLQKVVNQIAGKTVSEALVQLRFSKKKVARDVIKGLEIAQNEAIVGRGMGLGGELASLRRWNKQRAETDFGRVKDIWNYKTSPSVPAPTGAASENKETSYFQPTTIELKHGKKKTVRDPSEIYIDQAWVGPGWYDSTPEFRARGQVNMLKNRTASEFSPFASLLSIRIAS